MYVSVSVWVWVWVSESVSVSVSVPLLLSVSVLRTLGRLLHVFQSAFTVVLIPTIGLEKDL